MTTVVDHIQSADEAICRNIDSLRDQRALLSQNVLAQLRNPVEGVAVRLHAGRDDAEYKYAARRAAIEPLRTHARRWIPAFFVSRGSIQAGRKGRPYSSCSTPGAYSGCAFSIAAMERQGVVMQRGQNNTGR